MKHLFAHLLLMLTALVVLGDGTARAESINFSYQWTTLPGTVFPGQGASTGSVQISAVQPGTGQATLGDPVGTSIPSANVTTTSSATNPADSFLSNFTMKLHLTDTSSGNAGNLSFSGTLSGTLTATQSFLTGTFNSPLLQTLTLGTHVYSVTIATLFHPQPPGSGALVQISADISVASVGTGNGNGNGNGNKNTGGGTKTTPEPSSLVLGATAMLGLALRRLARRRAARSA